MTAQRIDADPSRRNAGLAIVKNAAGRHFSAVDLGAREVVADLGEGRYPHTARVHPDGRHAYLLYIASAHLEIVDLDAMATVARIDDLGTMPVGSAMTPDGEWLFVGTAVDLPEEDGPGVLAFEIGDDAVPRFAGARPLSRCAGMRIGPHGCLHVARKHEAEVTALTADADLEPVDRYPVGAAPHDLYRVPGGDTLAVNNADEAHATFIHLERGRTVTAATGENPHGVAFADGAVGRRAVFPAREDERVAVVDLESVDRGAADPTTALIDVGTTTGFAATTPDGRYAIVDSYDTGDVTILDLEDMAVAARVRVGGEPLHLVFAPDGRECYVGNMECSSVAVLDTAPLLDGRPADVRLADRIEGVGEKPSGIFPMEVDA